MSRMLGRTNDGQWLPMATEGSPDQVAVEPALSPFITKLSVARQHQTK
jgi:hypothetical protein